MMYQKTKTAKFRYSSKKKNGQSSGNRRLRYIYNFDRAPESSQEMQKLTFSADSWTVGVCISYISSGYHPFGGKNLEERRKFFAESKHSQFKFFSQVFRTLQKKTRKARERARSACFKLHSSRS